MSWLSHVKKTMASEKDKKKTMGKKWFSHVLKTAKKTYKKKGGAEPAAEGDKASSPAPLAGGKRRRGGKTRKVRKH